jgi:hypothetical protein
MYETVEMEEMNQDAERMPNDPVPQPVDTVIQDFAIDRRD